MSKISVYVIKDYVSDSIVVLGSAVNDATFIRQNLPYLSKINPNFKSEFGLYKVGYFVESTLELEPCEVTYINWDTYSQPSVGSREGE